MGGNKDLLKSYSSLSTLVLVLELWIPKSHSSFITIARDLEENAINPSFSRGLLRGLLRGCSSRGRR